jgi:hypothetical protein
MPSNIPPPPAEDPLAPPTNMAQAPPPPPPPSAARVEDPLAPPPLDNPPPVAKEPPIKKAKTADVEAGDAGTDSDTMISLAFGGILTIAAAVLLVIVRKNRAKKAMADLAAQQTTVGDLGQTQV